VKSVSCKGVRVQVVLPQAARSCTVSPGSLNTLQICIVSIYVWQSGCLGS